MALGAHQTKVKRPSGVPQSAKVYKGTADQTGMGATNLYLYDRLMGWTKGAWIANGIVYDEKGGTIQMEAPLPEDAGDPPTPESEAESI